MKKFLALFLVLATVLTLSACAGDPAGTTGPDGATLPPASGSTGSRPLRQLIPASGTVDLESGTWQDLGDYGALLFRERGEESFFAYQEDLAAAGYIEANTVETDFGMLFDYESMEDGNTLRILWHIPTEAFAIVVGQLPDAATCWALFTSSQPDHTEPSGTPGADSELRQLIPTLSTMNMSGGKWVEQDGYGALIFTGVEGDFYTVFDAVMDDMRAAGYSTGSSYGWGNAQIIDFRNIETKTMLRGGYNPETGILVMTAGKLPTRYTCWKLLGKTAQELGEPHFEDRVFDYMPDDATSCVYKYYTDKFTYNDTLAGYQLCDVSLTRLEKFIGELTAMGYTQIAREDSDNSVYYEARLRAYLDVEVYVTVQLAWTDSKLALAFAAPDARLGKDELMEHAVTYTGTATGRDPNAPPDEGYQPLDPAAATRVETVGGATIYYFEGGTPVESARAYIDALILQGYRDEQMPYIPDVKPYQIEYANNWLYDESMGDRSWVIVTACSSQAMIVTSAQQPAYREHDLWDMVGCYMPFGIGYLETVYTEFKDQYGVLGIGGESSDSNGFFANYGDGCTLENVSWMIGQLEAAGFTAYTTTTENGADIWVYTRTDSYELLSATIYARILLKDGFGEIEFGYTARSHSENRP